MLLLGILKTFLYSGNLSDKKILIFNGLQYKYNAETISDFLTCIYINLIYKDILSDHKEEKEEKEEMRELKEEEEENNL